jgi:hypothetical protein
MDEDFVDEEARQLQLALRNSRKDTHKTTTPIPEAPTYYPTIEEFQDPLEYVTRFFHRRFTFFHPLPFAAFAKLQRSMEYVKLSHPRDGILQIYLISTTQ